MRERTFHPPMLGFHSDQPLSAADLDHLITALWREGRLNHFNRVIFTYAKDGKNTYVNDVPEQLNVSAKPLDPASAEASRIVLPDAGAVHLSIEIPKHGRMPWQQIAPKSNSCAGSSLILVKDRDGILWGTAPETDGPLRQFSPDIAAIVALDTFGPEGGQDLRAYAPLRLTGDLSHERAARIDDIDRTPSPAFEAAGARAEALRQRRHAIRAIAKRFFSEDQCAAVFEGMRPEEITPSHSEFEKSRLFNDARDKLIYGFLLDLRKAGLLQPCPNNGPRDVTGLTAWNKWLALAECPASAEELPFEVRCIDRSPAWAMLEHKWTRSGLDQVRMCWQEQNPEGDYYKDREAQPLNSGPETDRRIIAAISAGLIESAAFETLDDMLAVELRSNKDDTRYQLWDSVLHPVLATRGSNYDQPLTVAPALDKPATARHFVLPVPSGRLFSADWPRIKGFNNAIDSLKRDFSINTLDGKIAEQDHLLSNFGVLKIFVGNSSPSAWEVGEGIYRLGHNLSNEDAEPTWRTCTDLWANTYVDHDQLVSILMASGAYVTPAAAAEAIQAYVDETWGASIIDVPSGELNFYVPNGECRKRNGFTSTVKIEEVPNEPESFHDYYVISEKPLTIREVDFAKHDLKIAGHLVGIHDPDPSVSDQNPSL